MKDNASPLAEEATAYYRALLRPVFDGRKFLIAGTIAAGLGGLAGQLTALGAARSFLIAANRGTGILPTREEAELRAFRFTDRALGTDFGEFEVARNVRPNR